MAPSSHDPTQVKVLSVLPAVCELFPNMEVPMGGDSAQTAEELQAGEEERLVEHINGQNLGWKDSLTIALALALAL